MYQDNFIAACAHIYGSMRHIYIESSAGSLSERTLREREREKKRATERERERERDREEKETYVWARGISSPSRRPVSFCLFILFILFFIIFWFFSGPVFGPDGIPAGLGGLFLFVFVFIFLFFYFLVDLCLGQTASQPASAACFGQSVCRSVVAIATATSGACEDTCVVWGHICSMRTQM